MPSTPTGQGATLPYEVRVHSLTKLRGALDWSEMDTMEVESDSRESLKTDEPMLVVDGVLTTVAMLEAFSDENMLRGTLKPDGR